MAERMSSRTAVRMAIGFIAASSTSMERTPSREGVDGATLEKEGSAAGREQHPRRRSVRVNGLHSPDSPGARHRRTSSAASPATFRSATVTSELAPPQQLSKSPAEGARMTTPPNEAALRHSSRVPIAIPEVGSGDAWQAAEEEDLDLQTPHGDRAQASRWVHFAWEPLVVGETEHSGGRHSPVPSNSGGGSGGSSVTGTISGATIPQEQGLSGGPALSQGDEMLGAKRHRASAGCYREETGWTNSTSCNNRRLTRRAPTDRTDWVHPSLDTGSLRRHPSLRQQPRRVDFEIGGGPASREILVSSMSIQEQVVGQPNTAGIDRSDALPLRAAGKRGGGGGRLAAGGGINARSSGWGRDAAMHNVTADEGAVSRRQVVTRGDGGATTAATMERQFQQEEESESREERGKSAKKTRYHHGLKVQGTLTVSHHVDSLTDGVSSLGVASPGGATASYSGGGKWEPVDAARRRRCEWWREAGFTGPTRYVLPQEPLRPVLALAEVGWNSDMRGAATIDTGAGAARGSTTTMYQKERRSMNSGAGIGGGSSGHRLSKKRKKFSLSAEAEASSPFRYTGYRK